MVASTSSTFTLFEEIAYRLGYGKLEDEISILPHPLISWGIVVFFVDVVVLQVLKEFEGYQATFFVNPTWLIQPVLGLLAPFVVVYLHTRYDEVLQNIDVASRTSDPELFERLCPRKIRLGLYAVLASYALYQFIYNIGVGTVTQVGGLSELIGVTVVLPLGYGILFAEFLATYIGILVFFPRRIRRTDFKINFLDPEGLGGLRPAGELMKSAYYFVVFGLIGFASMLYGPSIINNLTSSPYEAPGLIQDVLFTLVWILAIGTMVYGLSQIHWFMKRAKRRELTRLDREARELVEDPFDMERFEIRNKTEYDELRQRMEYINNTQEYPTTFTMWVQISIGILLPKAVQLVLSSV
ncbi:hypothetical protein [Haloarchaeobius litoreus]|uniref:Uncharacterized protein n=1 Tax=Haloarchaeobius litoreus TaxID=755306 RepID=A0ABD6DKJ4_9EURY|nr:hypothetical protein [Haloarchaeobius litoreus]